MKDAEDFLILTRNPGFAFPGMTLQSGIFFLGNHLMNIQQRFFGAEKLGDMGIDPASLKILPRQGPGLENITIFRASSYALN